MIVGINTPFQSPGSCHCTRALLVDKVMIIKIKYIVWLGILKFLNMALSLKEGKKQIKNAATEFSLLTLKESFKLIKDN